MDMRFIMKWIRNIGRTDWVIMKWVMVFVIDCIIEKSSNNNTYEHRQCKNHNHFGSADSN